MPAAIPAEIKEKVKVIAVQVGVREAARLCEIPESTVQSWSQREGWMEQVEQARKVTEQHIEKRGLRPVATKDPAMVLATLGNKSKLRAAKLGDNTLRVLQRKAKATDGESLIPLAPVLKTTVDTLDKVHSWSTPAPSMTQVNVNVSGVRLADS